MVPLIQVISRYYDGRPLAVLFRIVEAGLPLSIWAASIVADKVLGKLHENEALRARELRGEVCNLMMTSLMA